MKDTRQESAASWATRGFTLLELLVVMAIIAILTAVVVPRVGNSLSNLQLKSSARSVASYLRYANSKAMTRKMVYLVLIDLEKNALAVLPATGRGREGEMEPSEDGAAESGGYMVYTLPEDVRFDIREGGDETQGAHQLSIYFFGNGTSSGGSFLLENSRGKAYVLNVDVITSQVQISALSSGARG